MMTLQTFLKKLELVNNLEWLLRINVVLFQFNEKISKE